MKINIIPVLKRAKQLLIKKGWGQKCFAKFGNGQPCWDPTDTRACNFCLSGVLAAASKSLDKNEAIILNRELRKTIGLGIGEWISSWNDDISRTKEEVIKAIDDTIARLYKKKTKY